MNFFLISVIVVFLFGFVAGRWTLPSARVVENQVDDAQAACSTPAKPKLKAPVQAPNAATESSSPKTEQELLAQIAQSAQPCNPDGDEDTSAEEIVEDHEDDGSHGDSLNYEETIRNETVPMEEGQEL